MELTLNPISFKENKLGEIPQTVKTLFSFAIENADKTVDRLHELVKCRDFLGDVLISNKYKIPFSIYGFDAGRVKLGEDLDFVVEFPTDKAYNNFMENYEKIIHVIEKENDLKLTEVKLFKNVKSHTILVKADKWWAKAIPLISLYTFLIKVCCYTYTNPQDWIKDIPSSVEKSYVSGPDRQKIMKLLLDNLKFVFSEFPTLSGWADEKNKDVYALHNSSGFYTLFMNGLTFDNFYTKKLAEVYKK